MPGKPYIPKRLAELADDATHRTVTDAEKATWNAASGALPPHDNSGAGSPYALAVGETAYVSFSAATSVPLNIATDPAGEYEIIINCVNLTSPPANSGTTLSPNNTTYAGKFIRNIDFVWAGVAGAVGPTENNVNIGYGNMWRLKLNVSTVTAGKAATGQAACKQSNGSYGVDNFSVYWNDTTTVWSSLGTITFPYAHSGKVIIRRII